MATLAQVHLQSARRHVVTIGEQALSYAMMAQMMELDARLIAWDGSQESPALEAQPQLETHAQHAALALHHHGSLLQAPAPHQAPKTIAPRLSQKQFAETM